uniref:Uncharacterized protein n=1 Tax=Glossina austeni TaxID=7395 RepID=A0A1A9VP98_GLOAU
MINDISGFDDLRNELKKIFIEIDDFETFHNGGGFTTHAAKELRSYAHIKMAIFYDFRSEIGNEVTLSLYAVNIKKSVQVEKDLSQQQQPLVGWLERQLEKILNL